MRLFTKLILSTLLAASSLVSALAGTVTITVGDNFYRGPDGTSTITMAANDQLVFSYPTGNSSHPTMSDSSPAAWSTFPMNPNSRTKTFAPNTFTPGTYAFHCTAHSGQTGTLIVTAVTATADARLTAPVLNLFPNPSKGQVTLQISQRPGQDVKLRLNNVIGQEVRSVALKPELLANGQVINLSDLPSGVYFYSVLVNDKVMSTKRLILQNN
ncbi:T9SS type A sorting domain-containing protein [Hymenobacter sp. ASUV-10]|uniref:T9SS type A sorting domain-containing protein n=1 Tax=Hymenobacter aranciens TaxID=3063996 RepID=A0ABT9BA08_9BACT|nr:T9SS type A sorting domain-containing protein [Hymenobacter sp. ASUV-10]MDO7874554.1 T9SS type A sorting domain-containing protein [Hymenobacter sp. ASUV-10]